jgi:phospholipid transport system substrate-binding protein
VIRFLLVLIVALMVSMQAGPVHAAETEALADEAESAASAETEATADEAEPDAGVDGARVFLEEFYASLLDVMKRSEQLAYEGRYAELDPVIRQVYDLPFMSAKTLGRHWKGLSEQDRERWVSTFSRMTVSTYADRFEEYSGQQFQVLSAEPASHETVMVRTRIVPVDDDPVELDYRVRGADGSWRIIDVFMNGTVSELALRRSEYSSVFKRDGFESLLASMEEKIAAP